LTCLAGKRYVLGIPTILAAASQTACHHRKKEWPHAQRSYKKPPATVLGESQELENQIRQRAYELYETRGREDGHDLEDWLRAEEQVTAKTVRGIAA
jgi:Protein of unknown function (DUF2934)